MYNAYRFFSQAGFTHYTHGCSFSTPLYVIVTTCRAWPFGERVGLGSLLGERLVQRRSKAPCSVAPGRVAPRVHEYLLRGSEEEDRRGPAQPGQERHPAGEHDGRGDGAVRGGGGRQFSGSGLGSLDDLPASAHPVEAGSLACRHTPRGRNALFTAWPSPPDPLRFLSRHLKRMPA